MCCDHLSPQHGQPVAHGELPLLSTVHPRLSRSELSWADRLEVHNQPAKQELCGGELDPVHEGVTVLDESPGDLIQVGAAAISVI